MLRFFVDVQYTSVLINLVTKFAIKATSNAFQLMLFELFIGEEAGVTFIAFKKSVLVSFPDMITIRSFGMTSLFTQHAFQLHRRVWRHVSLWISLDVDHVWMFRPHVDFEAGLVKVGSIAVLTFDL